MWNRLRQLRSWLPIVAVIAVALVLAGQSFRNSPPTGLRPPPSFDQSTAGDIADDSSSSGATSAPAKSSPNSTPDSCEAVTGVETIDVADLPDEAIETLDLIADDGPYPFRQDDGVFQNRERVLPKHPKGYYREYTVVTPGSDDRGARRIIGGECGDHWYTADHYDSFQLIVGEQ